MALVRRTVERIIESDPTIRTGLFRGIINSRALSRYILENCAVDSTPDAVLGILRRYPLDGKEKENRKLAFKGCDILMRTGVGYLTIEDGPDVMKKVAELTSTIRSMRGESFRVIVGSNLVRIITRQEALLNFKAGFRSKEIISYFGDLAEVCLLLPNGPERLGEIATSITSQLTLHGVDPVGIMVVPPEDIIIVPEADAPRTLEAVNQLVKDESGSYVRKVARMRRGLPKSDKRPPEIFRLDDSVMSPILAF